MKLLESAKTLYNEVMTEWFRGSDYLRIVYLMYAMGSAWTLKNEYVMKWNIIRRSFMIVKLLVSAGCTMTFVGLIYDAHLLRNDIEKLTFSLSTTIMFIGTLIRIVALAIKKDELEECFNLLRDNFNLPWVGKSERDLMIFKSGDDHLKKITLFFCVLMGVGLPVRVIVQLAPPERNMMIPFPFFKWLETPFFEVFFAVQTFGFLYFMGVVIAQELMIYGVLIRISKHFDIIAENVMKIANLYPETLWFVKPDKENIKSGVIISKQNYVEIMKYRLVFDDIYYKNEFNRLSFVKWRKNKTQGLIKEGVLHHRALLTSMKKINKTFKESLLVQIFGGGFLLVIIMVDTIWKSSKLALTSVTQAFYAASTLFAITMLCYYGSKVESKSQEAANTLYASPWLEMDVENRRAVKMYLMALWKHPKLSAGNIVTVNLNIYIKFINMIYNCMAFMQNTAKRDG